VGRTATQKIQIQLSDLSQPITGSFTGSFTGDGTNLTGIVTDLPDGTVSSSLQFNDLTSPFTGSFTGSFTGDGSQLTGISSEGGFPYTGSADVSGSMTIDGPFEATSITETSALRYKTDIRSIYVGSVVSQLRPVKFNRSVKV